MNIWFIIFEKI